MENIFTDKLILILKWDDSANDNGLGLRHPCDCEHYAILFRKLGTISQTWLVEMLWSSGSISAHIYSQQKTMKYPYGMGSPTKDST